jgi:hypothetical protein
MYHTRRNGEPAEGRSMVCCVFVCSLWKAAGVFGDTEINCGELTNYDVCQWGDLECWCGRRFCLRLPVNRDVVGSHCFCIGGTGGNGRSELRQGPLSIRRTASPLFLFRQDYALKIFAGSYTQMTGVLTLSLNDFNTRELIDHYAEACPGQPPSYAKPDQC